MVNRTPNSCYWRVSALSLAAAAMLTLSGCAGMSYRDTNTIVGATAGAVVGGALTGTTTGAAVGAAAGGIIGNEAWRRH
jgi:osmotically inducible lipoprotein OsmB